jgi:hypothetical protein
VSAMTGDFSFENAGLPSVQNPQGNKNKVVRTQPGSDRDDAKTHGGC